LLEEWKHLFAVRNEVFSAIELERKQGKIGKGLDSKIEILAPEADFALLKSYSESALAEFFNVSFVEVRGVIPAGDNPLGSKAVASPAGGTKCNRCWRYTKDTSDYGIWKGVCARCQSALREMGIDPPAEAA